jgi:lysophospholipase L1-like esterase
MCLREETPSTLHRIACHCFGIFLAATLPAGAAGSWKFDFGPGKVRKGYTQVLPTTAYSTELGYGFVAPLAVNGVDRAGRDPLKSDFCTSDQPFHFSVALPEGNYKVTMTLGDSEGATTNTVKAELRRLMIEDVRTEPGRFVARTFTVNIRTPRFATNGTVRLKPREKEMEMIAWDDQLTLEFNGARPCVCSMEITSAPDVPTVFLLGDSTVCDQSQEPWSSWGQMLTRFLKPGVAVANHAESGESIASSLSAHRFEKVFSQMKKGDLLLLQFGHNDMKDKKAGALDRYQSNLKTIVTQTRSLGGTPVLITSMERMGGVEAPTLMGYPDAVREVARQEGTTLIDLNAMSLQFYRALGTNLNKAFQDPTHHNNYGSYQLAKCIVHGIRTNRLSLAKYIVDDFRSFDPGQPDAWEGFYVPPSPASSTLKPEGN